MRKFFFINSDNVKLTNIKKLLLTNGDESILSSNYIKKVMPFIDKYKIKIFNFNLRKISRAKIKKDNETKVYVR